MRAREADRRGQSGGAPRRPRERIHRRRPRLRPPPASSGRGATPVGRLQACGRAGNGRRDAGLPRDRAFRINAAPPGRVYLVPRGATVLEHWDNLVTAHLHGLGWPGEAFVELLLAAVAGGVVGLEREVRGRQAGFRTNILVAVGSALVMIVSTRIPFHDWPNGPERHINITVDPARIAYSVMTGVGFLGAGIIVQHRGTVRGLTTVAGIWCVASLGLAAGLGLYLLTVFGTLLVVSA